tara:strand:+ start:332998 stop:333810 length:813 start_codon:yes stop_codon:yes gene_type:complete
MQKKLVYILLLTVFSYTAYSQETTKMLKGRIISVTDKKPLESAHVLNLNSVEGTITNRQGLFQVPAIANDTILISYIGYQSIKLKVTNDLLKGNELEIAIHEKTAIIDEITVKAHDLIGVLVVDAENIPLDKFNRIHIDGLPQAYEIGRPQSKQYNSAANAIFNPIDFWYNKFNKKSKELKKLKKLKDADDLRNIMEEKFSREVLMTYMDMSRKDLNDLLNECNYSERFIKNASDLQIIEAVLECYDNYKAIKEGKVKKDVIHVNKNDNN